jgi:hypothetical protein
VAELNLFRRHGLGRRFPGGQIVQRLQYLSFLRAFELAAFLLDGGFERLQAFVAFLRGKDDVQDLIAGPASKPEPRRSTFRWRWTNCR